MSTLAVHETERYGSARPRIVDVPYVSKYLDVRESTLYALIKEGRIPPAFKVGKLVRVDLDRLEQWLQAGGSLSEEK